MAAQTTRTSGSSSGGRQARRRRPRPADAGDGRRVAVGYCRVSTAGQASDGVSLYAQRDRVAAWCEAQGLSLTGTYVDAGLSGGRADNRPQLQLALDAACAAGGVLVVYSLSRLARSTRDTIAIGERLAASGADLASLTESIDTSGAAGRMVFRLLAVLAEFERDLVAERTTAAMTHLRRQGRRISRHLPYGYRLAADGRGLVEDPAERTVLTRMLGLRAAGGSYARIAEQFNTNGVPPKAGVRWWPSGVRSVLLAEGRRAKGA